MAREPVTENIRLSHMFEYVTSAHLRLPAKRPDCVSFTDVVLAQHMFIFADVQVVKRWIFRSR
jgi:hypothetical protein